MKYFSFMTPKNFEIFQVYKKLFYAISDICVRYSNPSLFCAIFATCFCVISAICLSTGLNPNHNKMVLRRVKKEAEVVFHPSATFIMYLASLNMCRGTLGQKETNRT